MRKILPLALKHQVPVTFRAAGTSLSGQALTDSVLLKLSHTGRNFRNYTVHGDGSTITVEPGLIGGEINRILAAHKVKGGHPVQYKIGPDPSSIDSCMVGRPVWVMACVRRQHAEGGSPLALRDDDPRFGFPPPGRRHRVQQLVRHVLWREPEHLPHAQGHAHCVCGRHRCAGRLLDGR